MPHIWTQSAIPQLGLGTEAGLATACQVFARPFTSLKINSPSEPSSEQPQNER